MPDATDAQGGLVNVDDALLLNELNAGFYRTVAPSFSRTREHPWAGWERAMELIGPALEQEGRLIDAGCGNLRFESFVRTRIPETALAILEAHVIDNCPEFAACALRMPSGVEVHLYEEDLCRSCDGDALAMRFARIPTCGAAVCFGLMHHVPLDAWRQRILSLLLSKTHQHGVACVSFWQFAEEERMRDKALARTQEGCARLGIALDADRGDFLLGWQDDEDALRYCHSFSDDEVEELIAFAAGIGWEVADDFRSDGRTGTANRYIVWKAR